MSRRVPTLVATLSFWAVACGPQQAQVDTEPAEMAMVDIDAELAALQAADARYSEVAGAMDVAGFTSLYAPEAVMYPDEGPVVSGLDAIRAMIGEFAADPAAGATFEFIAAEVSADGDMGYTLNLAEVTGTNPDGQVTTERIRDFHVWRKQDDGNWKIVIDIWNAEPPAESM